MVDANEEEMEAGEGKPVDLKLILGLLGYVGGSVLRHLRLAIAIVCSVFLVSACVLYALPKTYHVQTRLFAQHNPALAVKGDNQAEGPSHTAAETIFQHDNLVSIARQTDLAHEWYKHRPPLGHLKDVIVKALGKHETEQEAIAWLTDVFGKKLSVSTPNEGVIQIDLDWADPVVGLKLIEATEQNYLEARRATEVNAIGEQVAILQSHAAELRKQIDDSIAAIDGLRAARMSAKPSATASASPPPPLPAAPSARAAAPVAPGTVSRARPQPDPELGRLKDAIEAKKRAIAELEEFRRRHLSELNASLAEKSATYTENHPVIIDLRQTIASLQSDSPEATALRADVARLQHELDTKTAEASGTEPHAAWVPGAVAGTPPLPSSIIRIEQEPPDERDPEMMYARTQLRDAMDKYSNLRAQIEMGQIEFDTAQAAFKYRYTILDPPVYPKGPSKPNSTLILLGGLAGGIIAGMLAAVAAEIRRGRFVAAWQVERVLDIPVLTELDTTTLAQHRID